MAAEPHDQVTTLLDVMAVPASGDPAVAVIDCGEPGRRVEEIACDVLVVGGGTGGIAAALAAARAGSAREAGGWRVCLLEETDWIGGQLTAQGSALDEHEASSLNTRSYYALREGIAILPAAVAAPPRRAPNGLCW